ncbi:GGDEF domain-containing protein [Thermoleophilia bacterium SCSIO 60948]|nr:GGDEF domain-containing protein [Thermoleophilia bacterium SCSIO 60948]
MDVPRALGAPVLSSSQRRTSLSLAIAGMIIPILVAVLSDLDAHHLVFFIGAVTACVTTVLATTLSRSHPVLLLGAAYAGIPALTAMQAYSGGPASGYSILLVMSMVWFGFNASNRELLGAVALLAACAYLPMLVFGPPAYPVNWGNATLILLIGVAVMASLSFAMREVQRLAYRLSQDANTDRLTGLLNRRGWEQYGTAVIDRAFDSGERPAVVVLDLDALKQINDGFGHDEGDRVIRGTARRIRETLVDGELAARIGGDEFVLLLAPERATAAAAIVADLHERTPALESFSAGIATWRPPETLDQLVARCDPALYAAKLAGGARSKVLD